MSLQTTASERSDGWGELLGILRALSPFAAMVWAGTVAWTVTNSMAWTIGITATISTVTAASAFGPREHVRLIWANSIKLVLIVSTILSIGFIAFLALKFVFVGVAACIEFLAYPISIVASILLFPFRHPFLFGAIIFFYFVGKNSDSEPTMLDESFEDTDDEEVSDRPKRKKGKKTRDNSDVNKSGAKFVGYWLETTIRLPKNVRTPGGGSITLVNACIDLRYSVCRGEVTLHSATLSRDGGLLGSHAINVSAQRTGEAWYARSLPISDRSLLEAAERDLKGTQTRLRKLLIGCARS